MYEFIIAPIFEELRSIRHGSRDFVQTNDAKIKYRGSGGDMIFEIKSGFTTDFASIPRLIDDVLGVDPGPFKIPGYLHDWRYKIASYPRLVCDLLFLFDMKAAKIPFHERHAAFWAVRIFGKSHYTKKKSNKSYI